jgi:hypothetical protein
MCHPLPDAYADLPRLLAVADTLGITMEAANQAFAQYVPRDAIEADLVEQIILTRARLNAATKRVLQPDLLPGLAARIDRGINTTARHLRLLIERLERRQNTFTGHLPQQYWRIEPIQAVGPADTGATPAPVPDEIPASPPIAAQRWTDPPEGSGDALARLAAMRIDPGMDDRTAWAIAAAQAPGHSPAQSPGESPGESPGKSPGKSPVASPAHSPAAPLNRQMRRAQTRGNEARAQEPRRHAA